MQPAQRTAGLVAVGRRREEQIGPSAASQDSHNLLLMNEQNGIEGYKSSGSTKKINLHY